ncbi:uncharacterized protein AB9W97_010308 [Spinachia spinachia]
MNSAATRTFSETQVESTLNASFLDSLFPSEPQPSAPLRCEDQEQEVTRQQRQLSADVLCTPAPDVPSPVESTLSTEHPDPPRPPGEGPVLLLSSRELSQEILNVVQEKLGQLRNPAGPKREGQGTPARDAGPKDGPTGAPPGPPSVRPPGAAPVPPNAASRDPARDDRPEGASSGPGSSCRRSRGIKPALNSAQGPDGTRTPRGWKRDRIGAARTGAAAAARRRRGVEDEGGRASREAPEGQSPTQVNRRGEASGCGATERGRRKSRAQGDHAETQAAGLRPAGASRDETSSPPLTRRAAKAAQEAVRGGRRRGGRGLTGQLPAKYEDFISCWRNRTRRGRGRGRQEKR